MEENNIKIFTTNEFNQIAQTKVEKIFNNLDPLKKPFNESISSRLIINDGLTLENDISESIFSTAYEAGDHGFFMTIPVVSGNEFPGKSYHWYVPLSKREQYSKLLWGPVANIVFSPSCKWGIILDYEIILLGGTKEFVDSLISKCPKIENQVHEFLDDCRYDKLRFGSSSYWLSDLMEHIYGKSKGADLLQQYNLP